MGCVQETADCSTRASQVPFQPLSVCVTQHPGDLSTIFIYNLDHVILLLTRCQWLSLQTHHDVLTLSPVCVSELLLWFSLLSPTMCPRHARVCAHMMCVYTPSGSHSGLFCVGTFAYATLSAWNTIYSVSHASDSTQLPPPGSLGRLSPVEWAFLHPTLHSYCIALFICIRALITI